jgi:SAM-dependent methyltransferase
MAVASDTEQFSTPEHRCRACGGEATGTLCAACEARAAETYVVLDGGRADGSGYDAAVFAELAALEPTSFWFRGRSKILVWALARHFPEAESFLEVGCGTGYTLASIRDGRPGLAVAGGDVHAEALEVARGRLPGVPLFKLDACALPFDEDFDVVGAFDVVEHIEDDLEALRNLAAAASPGGGVVLTVPQHPWLWSPVDDAARHQRRYTRKELVGKLRAVGLTPVAVTSFMSLLLPVMAAARKRATVAAEYDFRQEFELPRALDRALEGVVSAERSLLRAGLTFPAGGSLLAVARRAS